MYLYNGKPVNLMDVLLVNDTNYAPGWFFDSAHRTAAGIIDVPDPTPPVHTAAQRARLVQFNLLNGTWYPQWKVEDKTADELAQEVADLAAARAAKNEQINSWRAAANQSSFLYAGKTISCDALSRSDIDGVANSVTLSGSFPAGFPMAWKAVDDSYLSLADVDAFKAMYAAMAAQGTANFNHSQVLKAQLVAAQTLDEIAAIVW